MRMRWWIGWARWTAWLVGMVGMVMAMSACAPDRAGTAEPEGSPAPTPSPTSEPGAAGDLGRVLVFSRTGGFRHASIADARAAFERLAKEHEFTVDLTEDPGRFTASGLAPYDVVVFLHTTGHVLDRPEQAAFERWLAGGKGWAGIHGAADADPDWPWYLGLVGARFTGHPDIQPATIRVEGRAHPATSMLPAAWPRTDEWYNFERSPRATVHVLATLDEQTFEGGTMGEDHPLAWCHAYGGGRAFYTALGHTEASWTEPLFLAHVLGGVRWAGGAQDAACRPG